MVSADAPRRVCLLRCVAVGVGATVAAGVAVRFILREAVLRPATVEQAVVGCCVLALLTCVGWAWLAAMAVVLEAGTGTVRTHVPGVPPAARRLLLVACGVVVASALAQPASAARDDGRRDPLAGLPLPDRAVGAAHAAATSPRPVVVVGAGDSLWSLAAENLGPGASPAAVDARWRSIYRLNRALIGPDPDLIHPGQLLPLPPSP